MFCEQYKSWNSSLCFFTFFSYFLPLRPNKSDSDLFSTQEDVTEEIKSMWFQIYFFPLTGTVPDRPRSYINCLQLLCIVCIRFRTPSQTQTCRQLRPRVQVHYFIWQLALLLHSYVVDAFPICRESESTHVSVHGIAVCVDSQYVEQVPEIFSSSSQAGVTCNRRVVCSTSRLYNLREPNGSD